MPFLVPKFIERKPKIVGPLTFQQFIYLGAAAAICIVFYYTAPFYVFFISLVVLIGGGSILAFVKINGIPVPIIIKNFFYFSLSNKMYLWKKAKAPPKIIRPEKIEKEKKGKAPVLDIAEKSRLKNLSTRIETGQR